MLIDYANYYRRFGIRKDSELLSPRLFDLRLLSLPKGSILHYPGEDAFDDGPSVDQVYFQGNTKPILVQNILEVGAHLGSPIKRTVLISENIRRYHINNRRMRPLRDVMAAIKDDQTLVVENYSYIDRLYKYQRSIYSGYYQTYNKQAALWQRVDELASTTGRQQFIPYTLPKLLPTLSDLNLAAKAVTQTTAREFASSSALTLLQLWQWLGDQRNESLIGKIKPENYSKVNLLLMESGKWAVLNLGVLDSWRKATEQEVENDASLADKAKKGKDGNSLKRWFLVLNINLMDARSPMTSLTEVALDAKGLGEGETPEQLPEPSASGEDANIDEVIAADNAALIHDPDLVQDDAGGDEDDAPGEPAPTKVQKLEQIVTDRIAQLEVIKQIPQKTQDADEQILLFKENDTSAESGVIRVADALADNGILSANEYKRYQQLASAYKSIVSPDGIRNLGEFADVTWSDVAVAQDETVVPAARTILDKSMLKSTLVDFDRKYIKEVLPRHIAAMALNLQQAGIAITGYDVERINEITGAYDIITIKANPIIGAPSTLRMKVPALSEDATFRANSVKYTVRKMLSEVPIRKVSPSRVSLNSYYGKTFVQRSDKKVNNYAEWLKTSVMSIALDASNPRITEFAHANTFDPDFACPRLYSILATSFSGFTVGLPVDGKIYPCVLNFDHTKREDLYDSAILKQYEGDGSVVMGKIGDSVYLVVDKNNNLYVGKAGVLKDFPMTFEEIVGISGKEPIDVAELVVYGKSIPLALVFGYYFGLEQTLKFMGITPRRAPAGARGVVIEKDEYAISFADETLIFNKRDTQASLVFAGFKDYHKEIRRYTVNDFNREEVYTNLLEAKGLGVRFIRELILMDQLFVDPITRLVLQEMNEPQTFRGLLLRACELLATDQHPDVVDMRYQRIKGSERFAGLIYGQLVQAVRRHNSLASKSRTPIDLPPFDVWTRLTSDPAKNQVSEINPFQNLKEQESITYNGHGGRAGRSMTRSMRMYRKSAMGVISGDSVDSGDVAINIYSSANPQFTSLLGTTRELDFKKTGAASILSSSTLLAPGADRD